jgi:hypothetical protein
MLIHYQGCCLFKSLPFRMSFSKFKEYSVQIPSQKNWIPSFRLDSPCWRPDSHQCLEDSNYSSFHPSRRLINMSGHSSVFDKKSNFLLRHKYGKTAATVRTHQVYIVRTLSLIRKDVEKNCNRLDVRTTPSGRQSFIWKLYAAEVQPSGR